MPAAEDLLREGRLDDALKALQDRVRKSPADPKARIFLFQLLALLGQWDRALNQLKVSGELDASALAMVQTYREALSCEVLRAEVFAGKRTPLVFGEPSEWIALLIEAVKLGADGQHEAAEATRERALELAPAVSGKVDGTAFDWIADADSRLGPVIEAIVDGKYYWIPFNAIARLHFEPPEDLRDLIWTPTWLTWSNGGESVGLIPTRYPGSETQEDAGLRRSQKTDWQQVGPQTWHGLGQRMLCTDQGDLSLLEVREIELAVAPAAAQNSGTAESD